MALSQLHRLSKWSISSAKPQLTWFFASAKSTTYQISLQQVVMLINN
jgi:hypothetical protein